MAKFGYNLIATAAVALLGVAFAQEAQAQQHRNPNLGHFYMARQQIQITDDSPIIRYKGNGGGGQPGAQAPNRPMPLPKAGFQRFSHQMPSYSNGLPQVNNGVPRPVPQRRSPSKRTGKGAKAGKWKAPKKKSLLKKKKKPTSHKMKSYSPYKGYDPKVAKKAPVRGATHSVSGHKTKTKVRGSILHWARGQR